MLVYRASLEHFAMHLGLKSVLAGRALFITLESS